MVGLISVAAITAPVLAGYTAQVNIVLFWILVSTFFLISYYLVNFQKEFQISYKIRKALAQVKPTAIFVFLEGVWEAMIFAIIPIYTLYFIQTPLKYGIFLSYLSFMGGISNFFLGKFTDRLQKRSVFLYPVTISLAILTFLFPRAINDLKLWVILTGAVNFILPLFWNLVIAIVVDTHSDLRLAFPGREIVLEAGRFFGLSLTLLSFYFEPSPNHIFIILGFAMLLFPASLAYNTKIKKLYQYL